jgi:hypothetical protein
MTRTVAPIRYRRGGILSAGFTAGRYPGRRRAVTSSGIL